MPRKKTKKKTNRPKKSFNLLRVILGILSVFALLISYQINANKEPIVCANSISCVKNLSVDIDNNAVGVFDGHTVIPPKIVMGVPGLLIVAYVVLPFVAGFTQLYKARASVMRIFMHP